MPWSQSGAAAVARVQQSFCDLRERDGETFVRSCAKRDLVRYNYPHRDHFVTTVTEPLGFCPRPKEFHMGSAELAGIFGLLAKLLGAASGSSATPPA